MKKRTTRRALVMSLLSLLLCCSMLVGTTFAWFTDSVTSGRNKIVAGNLDVELYYQNDTTSDWTKVGTETNVFKTDTLWEPGHTEVVKLKVVNEGTLALKYQLGVNVAEEIGSINKDGNPFKLSDYIKFAVIDGDKTFNREQAVAAAEAAKATALNVSYSSKTLSLDAKNDGNTDEKTVTLVVYMPTSVGNEANYKTGENRPEILLGLNLFATQLNAEEDSFGSDYDKDAWDKALKVSSIDELNLALETVEDGGLIVFANDIENADGVLITGKNITIDLNGKTFTVSEGASTNNRNFKINGNSNVTIKNGTMVAAGELNSGAYGTIRTEGSAKVTLDNVKLYNYRGNGLNIKACSGTTVIVNNSEIYSQYGGGVEAAGGTVELNGVKVEQKGMWTAPYNSMAISVNGGGKATVNSGTYTTECLTAEEANNQGTSHGPWTIGVLNSGGTLIVNGGTFSNDNFGDNSLATYARGLVLADTGAVIKINGGEFDAVKAIIDVTNNLGDTSRNPSATLAGGTFSADPSVSGLYASHLIKVADGYSIIDNGDGTWTVGGQKVSTATDFVDAIMNGKVVELTQDISLGKIDLTDAIDKDVVINANGNKITTTDAYGIEVTAGKNVTISNAEVEITKEGDYITYAAGFKIANGDYAGATLKLENCTIKMANADWAYAVTMPASVKNLNLVIDNCTLEGAIAVQCWGDNNNITITNSKLICNYTTNAMYTSYCVVLQSDGTYVAENNTLKIDNCEFLYSGVDNFNSVIKGVDDLGTGNTVTVTNCTYGEKVSAN